MVEDTQENFPAEGQQSLIEEDTSLTAYTAILTEILTLTKAARHAAARSVNSIMTATYWEIGRRVIEYEQGGAQRAGYGEYLMKRLAADLTTQLGRGFSQRNLEQMRRFYQLWQIPQTPSAESRDDSASNRFPLPWSHYVKLMSIKTPKARAFYETESLRNGWSLRQLERQINTQFYERTLLSRNKASMLESGAKQSPEDSISPEEELKDPFVLEFLDLKDEYSENELEEALIRHIESFLLELGSDFAFLGRQRRLRIGDQWFRVDLLFFHRRLRCLVVVDLKLGEFTHSDAGQMHLYLNYAREHWMYPGENPPVGLILCNKRDEAVAHYALEGLSNKVMAAEYQMVLPNEDLLTTELERTRKVLENQLSPETEVGD